MSNQEQTTNQSLDNLKKEIQLKAKLGIDFILAAGIVWFIIFLLWKYTKNTSYDKSVFTFMLSAVLLPLALGLSKIFKTEWKIKNNPLQPLGLWLNFAQLIYFPFLVFMLIIHPDYFIMAYAIVTGAHLFPYAWFYNEFGYAIAAVTISVGSLLIAIFQETDSMLSIPAFTSVIMFLLAVRILFKIRKSNIMR